jgi:hypothetical protein
MIFIQLLLQKWAHLCELLVALTLQRLDERGQLSVLLVGLAELVTHLQALLLFTLQGGFEWSDTRCHLTHSEEGLVLVELQVRLELPSSVTLTVWDLLGFTVQVLHGLVHWVQLGDQVVDHAILWLELLVQIV